VEPSAAAWWWWWWHLGQWLMCVMNWWGNSQHRWRFVSPLRTIPATQGSQDVKPRRVGNERGLSIDRCFWRGQVLRLISGPHEKNLEIPHVDMCLGTSSTNSSYRPRNPTNVANGLGRLCGSLDQKLPPHVWSLWIVGFRSWKALAQA
jgi:hypothetical protein